MNKDVPIEKATLKDQRLVDLDQVHRIRLEDMKADVEPVEIAIPKKGFIGRAFNWGIRTIAGQTRVGKIGSVIKEGLSKIGVVPPVLNQGADIIGNLAKRKQKEKPMLKKILSIRNFINVKDENGNISPQEILASVIQILIAGAVVYAAVELGIWNELQLILTQ